MQKIGVPNTRLSTYQCDICYFAILTSLLVVSFLLLPLASVSIINPVVQVVSGLVCCSFPLRVVQRQWRARIYAIIQLQIAQSSYPGN